MIFDKPKLKPTSNSNTKFEDLCEQFKEAKEKSPEAFEHLILETAAECKQAIAREFSVMIPNYEIILCNNEMFDKLYAEEPQRGRKPSAFTNRLKGIIVINVEAALTTWGTFTVAIVLDESEEFVHAAFPFANEIDAKRKSHTITEKFLQIELPEEWKKAALQNAVSPDY